MTIRVPNLGLGDGKTGDTELKIRQDYNHNFSDPTNAASRLVGTAAGQVPLAQDTLLAASNKAPVWRANSSSFDANTAAIGDNYFVAKNAGSTNTNLPPVNGDFFIQTKRGGWDGTGKVQTAFGNGFWSRSWSAGAYTAWQPAIHNFYSTTTAAGANVTIDSVGTLMRSTSSERYKDILAPLVLDDAKYAQAIALKPIVYRSTAEADNPAHHYYSFSAEELGAYDPAFTLWRTTEMVTDAEGNITEQPLAEKQAEGLNINALLAMSHAIAIKQDKLIKRLEARVAALEPKPEV